MRTITYSRDILSGPGESCHFRFAHDGVPVELNVLIIERRILTRRQAESWFHPDPFFSRIFMFRRGGAALSRGGRMEHLKKGVIYLIPEGLPFTLNYNPSELFSLHVFASDITRQTISQYPGCIQSINQPTLFEAFTEAMERDTMPGIFAGTITVMGRFLENDMDRLAARARQAGKFLRLFEWLDTHPLAMATLSNAADLYGITPAAFSRRFQRAMGLSFKSYITKMQVQRAQHDLRYTDKQVAEISAELGHAYPQYFHRFFKKHCGCTPGDYRDKVRARVEARTKAPNLSSA